ncbi:MAG: acyl-CoA thioesterase II [Gammaproteobacteria bacterium]
MTDALNQLIGLFKLEPLDNLLFRGDSQDIGTGRIYGGQVLGQALTAMQMTVEHNKTVHSMHAYFMREGNHDIPIHFQVDISRDGKSFATRHVTALQRDIPIFIASASFQLEEQGLEYQTPRPDIPGPDAFKSLSDYGEINPADLSGSLHTLPALSAPFIVKPAGIIDETGKAIQYTWIKTTHPITGKSDRLHHPILAYISDYGLLTTILQPHGLRLLDPELRLASIDHGIWFHRRFRTDEWLLYECQALTTTGGRGLARGSVYRQDGTLIATTIQEGLLRQKKGQ